MPIPKPAKKSEPIDETPAMDAEALPAADVPPISPTLSDAFSVLAQALYAHYAADDHVPTCLHLEACQRLHADGNVLIAWSQLIPLLEGALGATLTRG